MTGDEENMVTLCLMVWGLLDIAIDADFFTTD
jgi:hypothetical protein